MSLPSDIGEDRLIARLCALMPTDPAPGAGPGDDCAVLLAAAEDGEVGLLKTDAVVCGVHFTAETPGRAVGWKAVARVISDFAAMGGRPERFLLTIAVSRDWPVAWLEDFSRGVADCLTRFGAVLVGGETTRLPGSGGLVVSVAAFGSAARDQVVLRSTGKPGDELFVTGTLGGSGLGRHLSFSPRLREAAWLVAHCKPSAMMDLSDGLAKDLPRLAAASGCGYELDADAVPVTDGCTVDQALGEGEDFELLFAVCPAQVRGLCDAWSKAFPGLPLTRVGRLTAAPPREVLRGGWDPFR